MLGIITRQREIILPTPNVLHDRSKVTALDEEILVDPDRSVTLHHFKSQVEDEREVLRKYKQVKDRLDRVVGERHWHDVLTIDGVDRGVTMYVPSDEIRSDYKFTVVMDTAWFTGLEGHNDMLAETFMKELGVSVMVIGPEFSADEPKKVGAATKLGKIAALSAGFSLMKSGEASAEIYDYMLRNYPEYNLQQDVIGAGESRGAMIEEIRRLYMMLKGINVLHSDLTDPNVSKQALQTMEDCLQTLQWPVVEGVGVLAVAAALAKKGVLHREIGTVPMNLRFMLGATLGMGPALLSGEEGMFADYTPLTHPQHIINSTRNNMAHVEQRQQNYKDHTNTTIIPLDICHLGLGFPSIQARVIDRSHEIGKMQLVSSTDHELWKKIHATGHVLAA